MKKTWDSDMDNPHEKFYLISTGDKDIYFKQIGVNRNVSTGVAFSITPVYADHDSLDLNIFDASFTKSIISVAGHEITEHEFEEQRLNILKQAKIILNK